MVCAEGGVDYERSGELWDVGSGVCCRRWKWVCCVGRMLGVLWKVGRGHRKTALLGGNAVLKFGYV